MQSPLLLKVDLHPTPLLIVSERDSKRITHLLNTSDVREIRVRPPKDSSYDCIQVELTLKASVVTADLHMRHYPQSPDQADPDEFVFSPWGFLAYYDRIRQAKYLLARQQGLDFLQSTIDPHL